MTSTQNRVKRPSSSNTRSLQAKFSVIEPKYSEFIHNCSAYLRSSETPSRVKFTDNRRHDSSDISKENSKLRRQNEILTKTLQELSRLEKEKTAGSPEPIPEHNASFKTSVLAEQLQESKQMVEKLTLQLKTFRKPEKEELAKSQENRPESLKKSASPARTTSRSQMKERNFTPIQRSSMSPIYQTVSDHSRRQHSLKKQVKDLQAELAKVKEERDLLRVTNKIQARPGPQPVSIELIVAQYETEVQRLQAINSILEKNFERLAKFAKAFIKDSAEIIPCKRAREIEPLKMKIFDLIRENIEIKHNLASRSASKSRPASRPGTSVNDRKVGKALDDLMVHSVQVSQFKLALENEKFKEVSMSAPITAENFFDCKGVNETMNFSIDFGQTQMNSFLDLKDFVLKTSENCFNQYSLVFSRFSGFTVQVDKVIESFFKLKSKFELLTEKNFKLNEENLKLKQKFKDFEGLIDKLALRETEIVKLIELKKKMEDRIRVVEKEIASKDLESQETARNLVKVQEDLRKSCKLVEELRKKNSLIDGNNEKLLRDIESIRKALDKKNIELSVCCENLTKATKEAEQLRVQNENSQRKPRLSNEPDLAEQVKSLKNKINEKDFELSQYKKSFLDNQVNYEEIISDKNSQINKLNTQVKEINSMKLNLDKKEKELQELSFGLVDQRKEYEKVLNDAKSQNEKILNEKNQILRELDEQVKIIAGLEKQLKEAKEKNLSLTEINSLKAGSDEILKKTQELNQGLEERIEKYLTENDELRKRIKDLENEFGVVKDLRVKDEKIILDKDLELKSNLEELNDCRTKLVYFEGQVNDYKQLLIEAKSQISELTSQLKDQSDVIKSNSSELSQSLLQNQENQSKLLKVQQEQESTKLLYENAIESLKDSKGKEEKLVSDILETLKKLEKSQEQIQNLGKILDSKEKKITEIEDLLKKNSENLKNKLALAQELTKTNDELKKHINYLETNESESKKKLQELDLLKENLNSKDKEIKKLIIQIESYEETNKNLEQSEESQQKNMIEQARIIKTQQANIELLTESNSNLNLKLNNMIENLDSLQKIAEETEDLRSMLGTLETENSSLHQQLAESDFKILSLEKSLLAPKPLPKLTLCYENSSSCPSNKAKYEELQNKVSIFLSLVSQTLKQNLTLTDLNLFSSLINEKDYLILSYQELINDQNKELQLKEENQKQLVEKLTNFDLKLIETTHNLSVSQDLLNSREQELKLLQLELTKTKDDLSNLQVFYDSIYTEKVQLIEKSESLLETQKNIQQRLLKEQESNSELESKLDSLLLNNKKLELELDSKDEICSNSVNEKLNDIKILKDYIENLEVLNSSLEKTVNQLESRHKKNLSDKEDEYSYEISQINQKNQDLDSLNKNLQETINNLQGSIEKYKEKVNKIEKDLNSANDTIKIMKTRPKLVICMEYCETFIRVPAGKSDSIMMSPLSYSSPICSEIIPEISIDNYLIKKQTESLDPSPNLQNLLLEIEYMIQEQVPQIVINWCKKILGHANYIIRYQSCDSIISDESIGNIEKVDISVDETLDSQGKITQQAKIIENLVQKLEDKKERIKLNAISIKALQSEIRNLDNKIKQEGSIDLEYLRTSVINFSKGIRKIDKDSMKCLQVIQAQLGIQIDKTQTPKKWGLFNKKK